MMERQKMKERTQVTESNQNSLVFEYPFLVSSIKKVDGRQSYGKEARQNSFKNYPFLPLNLTPVGPQKQTHQQEQFEEQDVNDNSSIDLQDQQQQDMTSLKEIQVLEKSITEKLAMQFLLIKKKLSIKEKEKQNLLKQFRKISTLEPLAQNDTALGEKQITENIILPQNEKPKPKKNNPLNSRKIKDQLIKTIQDSQNLKPLRPQQVITNTNQIFFDSNVIRNDQWQNRVFTYTFNFNNQAASRQTPEFNKQSGKKQVVMQQNVNQSDLIRQMSEQLRKMEFRKVQEIAKGNFKSLRRK